MVYIDIISSSKTCHAKMKVINCSCRMLKIADEWAHFVLLYVYYPGIHIMIIQSSFTIL